MLLSHHLIERIENLKQSLLANNKDAFLTESIPHVFYSAPDINLDVDNIIEATKPIIDASIETRELLTIISAYFVPSQELLKSIQTLINKGIRIQVFTNSLESIDVTAAFSGYQRCRETLLKMGVELYEFRARPEYHSIYTTPAVNVDRFGLHAKSIIYDTRLVYAGTLNLDPRSNLINKEVGILIDNAVLAKNIQDAFLNDLSQGQFWQVGFNNKGTISWTCGADQTTIQPARGLSQRLANYIYSLLPIEQLL